MHRSNISPWVTLLNVAGPWTWIPFLLHHRRHCDSSFHMLCTNSKLLLLLFTTFTTTLTNSMQKGEHCNFENQQSRRCVCFNCTTIAIDLLLPASAVWVCDWFDWRFVWCHRYQQGRQFVSRWDVERLKRLWSRSESRTSGGSGGRCRCGILLER